LVAVTLLCLRTEELPYLIPGVQDHDIIGGEVVLGHLAGYLLNLIGGEGEVQTVNYVMGR